MSENTELDQLAENVANDVEKMANQMADEETFVVSEDDPDVEVIDAEPVEEIPAHAASPSEEEDPSDG